MSGRGVHASAVELSESSPALLWVNHFAVAPGAAGGTRHFEIGRELVRRRWKVTIAASDLNLHSRRYTRRADNASREAVREEIEGVYFDWLWAAPYDLNDWRRAANWLSFAAEVWRWSPGGRTPDVVIGSSPHLFAGLAAERLSRQLGVPFVLEVRDLWPESLLAVGRRPGPVYHLLDQAARYLYRRAARIIVLARGSAAYLEEQRGLAADKLVYIPNGVDLNAFDTDKPPARKTFTALYAGAHGPANGLDIVLKAAEQLQSTHPRIRFVLIGDGPSKAELMRQAQTRGLNNVEFRAPIPKREVPRTLKEADAGLMVLKDAPLFSYGVSPNKLFDYFGGSVPVVCNVAGEVAGMVQQARAGVQASDSGPAALAKALAELASKDPEQRYRMGQSGRMWVAKEHSRGVLADRLDSTLRAVID